MPRVVVRRRQALWHSCATEETDYPLGEAAGRSEEAGGIQTGRGRAFLDEVSQDLEHLRGIDDDVATSPRRTTYSIGPGGKPTSAPRALIRSCSIITASASLQILGNDEVPVPGQHATALTGNQVDPRSGPVLLEVFQD